MSRLRLQNYARTSVYIPLISFRIPLPLSEISFLPTFRFSSSFPPPSFPLRPFHVPEAYVRA